jgi:hypothetical protein
MTILVKGGTGKLRFTTANPEGVLYDPDDFVVTVRDPADLIGAGQAYTYVENPPPTSTVERTGFGAFLVRVADLRPGRYNWRARAVDPGDGNRVDVSEGTFRVMHSRVVTNAT